MQNKDDKVGNKTINKERKEGEKKRERKIEIDSQKERRKKSKFWLLRMREKQ